LPDLDFLLKGVKGTGITLGLTNGSYNYGLQAGSGTYIGFLQEKLDLYGKNVGTSGGNPNGTGQIGVGVTTDSSKSGIETEVNSNINYAIKY